MAGKDGFESKKLSSSGGKKAAQILPKKPDAASKSISLEHFYSKNRDLAERESAEPVRSPGFAIDRE
jgi:hypothetical protein